MTPCHERSLQRDIIHVMKTLCIKRGGFIPYHYPFTRTPVPVAYVVEML